MIAQPAPAWQRLAVRFLPFADAATPELPLLRLLRLSLFQVSVGMAAVMLTGTLNRVMIVELGFSAWLVGLIVAIPLLFAPLRALIGHRSDHHRSVLGWKRVPYIWTGTMLQFGGFAILPFALLVMTGQGHSPALGGQIFVPIAFLMIGAGMHTIQTAGLALATDISTGENAPRVVALLYVMLLIGMMISALVIGRLLTDYSPTRLVQVVQGVGLLTAVLNVTALWKQEARQPREVVPATPVPAFSDVWRSFVREGRNFRLLVAVGLGAAAFAMQDVLLEPYGGQVLGLGVGATTSLTALWAAGTLAAFAFAARNLGGGGDPHRLAGYGGVFGIFAFAEIIFAGALDVRMLLFTGAVLMGFGGGLFAMGTLTATMRIASSAKDRGGLALGAWGAVQATGAGSAILFGGLMRDAVSATSGNMLAGYVSVYAAEIILLLGTLAALGPLVSGPADARTPQTFGFADFPA